MNDHDELTLSRRQILQWMALATATLNAACNDHDHTDAATDVGTNDVGSDITGTDATDVAAMSDVSTLNDLLTAEYGAIKAYDAGAAILMSPPAGDPLASLAPTLLQVAARFQQQHRDHAGVLASTITAMGGTPVDIASVTFTPPATFTGTVTNVLKLACNAEKAAAVAYTRVVGALGTQSNRFLATSIAGDESQHYIVLFVLIQGLAQPGPNISTMIAAIVPTSFVNMVSGMVGLESVADYTYG